MEIQISDFAGIQLEFLELVDGIVLAAVLLGVDIEYPILVRIVRPVGSGDTPGQGGERIGHKTYGSYSRKDFPRQLFIGCPGHIGTLFFRFFMVFP